MMFATALSVVASIAGGALAASTFSPARPPAIPLAVRSPYLSSWLFAGSDTGNGGLLAGQWAQHWGSSITAWTGMIRVDGTTYVWMGAPDLNKAASNVTQTAFVYTSTKSIFTMDVAGKVSMNITFLSPVFPNDAKRQSLAFSYMNVDVESADGADHDVQLYTDISAEFVSGENDANAQWSFDNSTDLTFHKVFRQTQLEFSEDGNAAKADWGNWYYATNTTSSLTFLQDSDTVSRNAFQTSGKLANTKNTDFRPIQEDWPVFAYAVDLGSVSGAAPSQLFSLGYFQENQVQFNGTDGYQPLKALWTSFFDDEVAGLTFFHGDYAEATTLSNDLDNKIATDSRAAAGDNYLAITSLAVRQAFASMVTAIRSTGKTYWFLKEISSDGNVNTVDVVFPAHPILLYLNPDILGRLMDPLFENQESGDYPNQYAEHDIGAHFPNATGHPLGDDEEMPVEECGNMLIMALAYAQRTGDKDFLSTHYDKLKQWNDFLIEDSLIPNDQLSTDDFAGHLANQTNLALKGIIGIAAMGQIANLTGNTADSSNFSSIAKDYITQWQDLGIAKNDDPPHTTLMYGNDSSHGLLYNIYGDKLLGLGLVPQSVYDMQCAFYPTIKNKFGVPLDTRSTQTKGDWEMFTAATCDAETRDVFVSDLANWINVTSTSSPFTDLYDTVSGDFAAAHFTARPVVGGMFALLALNG